MVSVGQDAFADCPNLTTAVYYFGTSIGSNAFDKKVNVTIIQASTGIGIYILLFYDNINIEVKMLYD